jgi:hypothetical protein
LTGLKSIFLAFAMPPFLAEPFIATILPVILILIL